MQRHLGYVDDEEEAARAINAEARKRFTEEAMPKLWLGGFNFPTDELKRPTSSSILQPPPKRKHKEATAPELGPAPPQSAFRGVSWHTQRGKCVECRALISMRVSAARSRTQLRRPAPPTVV